MLINANISVAQCVENSYFKFLEINFSKNSKEKRRHISIKTPQFKIEGMVNITDDRTVFICILQKTGRKSYKNICFLAVIQVLVINFS